MQIVAEPTPNPNSMKFSWGSPVLDEGGPFDFPNAAAAEKSSPLAARIFRQNGVLGVFIARDFVSVTRHPGVGWEGLQGGIADVLREHVASGEAAVSAEAVTAPPAADPGDIESRIRAILDRDIRPAVAMDGGDIQFVGYNAGVVMLQMKGSCSGCPSSTATLKMGVENRLRQEIPEITEVLAMM
ncbi:MAG: NifU family protein [Planctomycetes bacterium]|nr:NifU family protein [Planctomycetota bacterium]